MSTTASLEIQVKSEEVKLAEQRLRTLAGAGENTSEAMSELQKKMVRLKEQMESLNKAIRATGDRTKVTNSDYMEQVIQLTRVTRAYNSAASAVKRFADGHDKTRREMSRLMQQTNKMSSAINNARNIFFSLQLAGLFRDIVKVGIEFDRFRAILTAVTGSVEAAKAEFQELNRLSNTLGRNVLSMADGYAQFKAAARGTNLTLQQQKELFESIARTSTVMQFDQSNTRGVIRAFEQMMSKGKVQAEELRLQLGDRLPGAFSLFVRAYFGASEATAEMRAEFDKLMKQGKIMSEDLLPKVAVELNKTFGAGLTVAMASAQSSMNRAQNSLYELLAIGWDSGIEESVKNMADGFTSFLQTRQVKSVMESIASVLKITSQFFKENATAVMTFVISIGALVSAVTALRVAFTGLMFVKDIFKGPIGLAAMGLSAAALSATMGMFNSLGSGQAATDQQTASVMGNFNIPGNGGSAFPAGMLLPITPDLIRAAIAREEDLVHALGMDPNELNATIEKNTDGISVLVSGVKALADTLMSFVGWLSQMVASIASFTTAIAYAGAAWAVSTGLKKIKNRVVSGGKKHDTQLVDDAKHQLGQRNGLIDKVVEQEDIKNRRMLREQYSEAVDKVIVQSAKTSGEPVMTPVQKKAVAELIANRFPADANTMSHSELKLPGVGATGYAAINVADLASGEIEKLQKAYAEYLTGTKIPGMRGISDNDHQLSTTAKAAMDAMQKDHTRTSTILKDVFKIDAETANSLSDTLSESVSKRRLATEKMAAAQSALHDVNKEINTMQSEAAGVSQGMVKSQPHLDRISTAMSALQKNRSEVVRGYRTDASVKMAENILNNVKAQTPQDMPLRQRFMQAMSETDRELTKLERTGGAQHDIDSRRHDVKQLNSMLTRIGFLQPFSGSDKKMSAEQKIQRGLNVLGEVERGVGNSEKANSVEKGLQSEVMKQVDEIEKVMGKQTGQMLRAYYQNYFNALRKMDLDQEYRKELRDVQGKTFKDDPDTFKALNASLKESRDRISQMDKAGPPSLTGAFDNVMKDTIARLSNQGILLDSQAGRSMSDTLAAVQSEINNRMASAKSSDELKTSHMDKVREFRDQRAALYSKSSGWAFDSKDEAESMIRERQDVLDKMVRNHNSDTMPYGPGDDNGERAREAALIKQHTDTLGLQKAELERRNSMHSEILSKEESYYQRAIAANGKAAEEYGKYKTLLAERDKLLAGGEKVLADNDPLIQEQEKRAKALSIAQTDLKNAETAVSSAMDKIANKIDTGAKRLNRTSQGFDSNIGFSNVVKSNLDRIPSNQEGAITIKDGKIVFSDRDFMQTMMTKAGIFSSPGDSTSTMAPGDVVHSSEKLASTMDKTSNSFSKALDRVRVAVERGGKSMSDGAVRSLISGVLNLPSDVSGNEKVISEALRSEKGSRFDAIRGNLSRFGNYDNRVEVRDALAGLKDEFEKAATGLSDTRRAALEKDMDIARLKAVEEKGPWAGRPFGGAMNRLGLGWAYNPFTSAFDERNRAEGATLKDQKPTDVAGRVVKGKDIFESAAQSFGKVFARDKDDKMDRAGLVTSDAMKLSNALQGTNKALNVLKGGFGALYGAVSSLGAFMGGMFVFGATAIFGAIGMLADMNKKEVEARTYTPENLSDVRRAQSLVSASRGGINNEDAVYQYEDRIGKEIQAKTEERTRFEGTRSVANKQAAFYQNELNAIESTLRSGKIGEVDMSQPQYDDQMQKFDEYTNQLKNNRSISVLMGDAIGLLTGQISELNVELDAMSEKGKKVVLIPPQLIDELNNNITEAETEINEFGMGDWEKKYKGISEAIQEYVDKGSNEPEVMKNLQAFKDQVDTLFKLETGDIVPNNMKTSKTMSDQLLSTVDPKGFAIKELDQTIANMRDVLKEEFEPEKLNSMLNQFRSIRMEEIGEKSYKDDKTDRVTKKYLDLLQVIAPVTAAQEELNEQIAEFQRILGNKATKEQLEAYRMIQQRAIDDEKRRPMDTYESAFQYRGQNDRIDREAGRLREDFKIRGYSEADATKFSGEWADKQRRDIAIQMPRQMAKEIADLRRETDELGFSFEEAMGSKTAGFMGELAGITSDAEQAIQEATESMQDLIAEGYDAAAAMAHFGEVSAKIQEQAELRRKTAAVENARSSAGDYMSGQYDFSDRARDIVTNFEQIAQAENMLSIEFMAGTISAEAYMNAMEGIQAARMNAGLDEIDLRIDMGEGSFEDGVLSRMGRWAQEAQNASAVVGQSFGQAFTTISEGAAQAFGNAIVYGDDLGEALLDVANRAVADLIASFVQLGIQMVVNTVMGQTAAAAATSTTIGQAILVADAWSAAAAAASLATLGTNLGPAMTAMAAAAAISKGIFVTSAFTPGFADGGLISGPGTSRSDSIMARLSNGEFVINAAATSRHIDLLEQINSNKFANGGLVGTSTPSAGRSFGGGNNYTANVTVQAISTGNAEEDARNAANTAKMVKREVTNTFYNLMGKEMRSGGKLSKSKS